MREFQQSSLTLAWLVLFGCGLLAVEDTLQPVQGLTVFDAKGKRVGTVIGFGNTTELPTVAFRVHGRLVILKVDRDRFTNSRFAVTNSIFFESGNCTGTAFASMEPLSDTFTLAPIHILNGMGVYAFNGPRRTVVVGSQKSSDSPNQCMALSSYEDFLVPLRLLIDLGTQFQPPFTLR